MRFYLPQQVFFCCSGSYCVFLDVERDQYFAVPGQSLQMLMPSAARPSAVEAQAVSSEGTTSSPMPVVNDLVAQGLLTTDRLRGKPFEPVAVAPAVPIPHRQPSSLTNSRRFFAFYAACHIANQRLTTTRIADTVNLIRSRKSNQTRHASVTLETLLSLTSTFHALRLFYPRPYLCLFDSLALLEFLSLYQIFPTWVFGVEGEPFHAHCWVQYRELLLNDSLPRVSEYTAIMAV